MTWGGKTNGPAINMGRARPHQVGGRMVYLHLDELRDVVVKAGWHTEPAYKELEAKFDSLLAEYGDLQADHSEALNKIDVLEQALAFKPKPTKPVKV